MPDPLLIPPLARDARCQVIAELAARVGHIDLSPLLVYLIDSVDASVLPYLAEQWSVLDEGWQYADTDADKRRLLHRAIDMHRYKGTRWAVENALDVLRLGCDVQEWFEYGGEPYHFRVDLVSNQGVPEDFYGQGIDRAVELITKAKNVRSHLDAIRIVLAIVSPVPSIGAALIGGEICTILPFVQTDIEQFDRVPKIGTGIQSLEIITVYPV
ncbi:MAG: phage tail protein I [Proteobacteria bacterium]|jgi:phage tail P2-like protein|nr:phage tail protein I [Pseudomonadota bacterium]